MVIKGSPDGVQQTPVKSDLLLAMWTKLSLWLYRDQETRSLIPHTPEVLPMRDTYISLLKVLKIYPCEFKKLVQCSMTGSEICIAPPESELWLFAGPFSSAPWHQPLVVWWFILSPYSKVPDSSLSWGLYVWSLLATSVPVCFPWLLWLPSPLPSPEYMHVRLTAYCSLLILNWP